MENNLINLTSESIAKTTRYKEFGTNDELQISYKTNGKDYVIETYDGERFELIGSTINSIEENTPYTIEDVMSIMYIIYNEYESFKRSIETSKSMDNTGIRKYTKQFQSKMVNTITSLLQKYTYEDVLAYFSQMRGLDLLTLFNGQDDKVVLNRLNNELTPDTPIFNVDENEEEEYRTGMPVEPVSSDEFGSFGI